MEKKYSEEIAEAIKQFLMEEDWWFSFDDENGTVRFDMCLEGKLKKISYQVEVMRDSLTFFAEPPIGPDIHDETMLENLLEFLERASCTQENGRFELDTQNGDIWYFSFIDCEETIPSHKMIKDHIETAARMLWRYIPGIIAIIFQHATVEESLDIAEKEAEEELCKMLRSLSQEELTRLLNEDDYVTWCSSTERRKEPDEFYESINASTNLLSEEEVRYKADHICAFQWKDGHEPLI